MTPKQQEQELIKEFGKEMQGKMDARSKKGRLGWRENSLKDLSYLLYRELAELEREIWKKKQSKRAIQKECADVANFAMMMWDTAK